MDVVARGLGAPREALQVHVVEHAAGVAGENVASRFVACAVGAGRELAPVEVDVRVAGGGEAAAHKRVCSLVNGFLRPHAFECVPAIPTAVRDARNAIV